MAKKSKKSAKSVTSNPCGGSHKLNLLLGCKKCQKAKKAAAKKKSDDDSYYRRTTGARAGLVKDEEWQRSKSLQQQFPQGW